MQSKGARRRLKKRQPAGDHEQRRQKEPVFANDRRRPKQQASRAVETKPHENPGLVPCAPHQLRSRHRQQKISQVESKLHQARLKPIDLERLHKLANQNVIEVVGHAPQKEERCHQNERQQPSRGNQRGFNVFMLRRRISLPCVSRICRPDGKTQSALLLLPGSPRSGAGSQPYLYLERPVCSLSVGTHLCIESAFALANS